MAVDGVDVEEVEVDGVTVDQVEVVEVEVDGGCVEEVEVDGVAVEEVEVDGAAVNEMKADEEELQRPLAAELRRPDPCRSRSQAGRPQSSHRRQITADHKKATSGKSFCPNPTSQAGRKLDRTPG